MAFNLLMAYELYKPQVREIATALVLDSDGYGVTE
jgi:hypothetical protein